MKEKGKKPKELFYIIPMHIFNIAGLSGDEKLLLAHIYSFGQKGCWQSNETLGKIFFTSARSISTWVSNLKKNKLVYFVHPKGRYRTLWSKTHPDVSTAEELLYMGEKIGKKEVINGNAAHILLRRNLPDPQEENCVPTKKNPVVEVGRNLLHTNNTTNKDTIKETTEQPPPLPAGGQAPAALKERTLAQKETIDNYKRIFGICKKEGYNPMSEAEFQDKVRLQRKALLALK